MNADDEKERKDSLLRRLLRENESIQLQAGLNDSLPLERTSH